MKYSIEFFDLYRPIFLREYQDTPFIPRVGDTVKYEGDSFDVFRVEIEYTHSRSGGFEAKVTMRKVL